MKTVKTSRQFQGGPISLRALCGLEDRTLPVSVMDIVASDGVRHFSGKITTGDVDCTWDMSVWQNGFWSVKGDFHEGGTLAGDFFFAEFLLDKDHSVGARLEGSILNVVESRHLTVRKDGSDRWIRENWDKFEGRGPTVRLHAAPAIGELVATPLVALAAVPSVVFVVAGAVVIVGGIVVGIASGGNGRRRMQRCPEGTLNVDLPGRDTPCVEIAEPPKDPT
jgi:hypothetical protein